MDKAEIRELITAQKKKLTLQQITEYSDKIMKQLKEQPFFKKTRALYIYVSYNEEVLTKSLIEYAFGHNIRVAVPKVKDKKMEFYFINSMDDLAAGSYGILEPTTKEIAENKYATVIMPGLAFDENGNRIGYGGGYYDEYLSRNEHSNYAKAAIAYDFQVVEKIETEAHDKKVDYIITENRIIETK